MSSATELPPVKRVQDKSAQSRWEFVLLGFSVASFLISCVLWSHRKQAWMDEIFTWKEVSDPSLWHLLTSIQRGADGGQPLFYITAWFWAKAFGVSDLSLRLYSSLGVAGALLVTWFSIRRFYGLWATALGVLTVWGSSEILLDQNAEARFYGLYLLIVSIAVALYLRLAAESAPKWKLLSWNLLFQAALVLTHVLGIIYGAMILAALVIFDWMQGRFRIKVYLTYIAGWLALLVWIPAVRASMAAGQPHGWIPLPTLYNLYDAYTFWAFLSWLLLIQRHAPGFVLQLCRRGTLLVFLLPLIAGPLLTLRSGFRAKEERALLLVGVALLCVPIGLYVLSHRVTPVLMPRYVLPSAIGTAIVLAASANWIAGTIPVVLRAAFRWVAFAIVSAMACCPVASALIRGPWSSSRLFLDVPALQTSAPAGMPLVVGWQPDFFKLMRYSQPEEQSNYFYLLDWPSALVGPPAFVLEYHLMQTYRDVGYFSRNIQPSQGFLCSHSNFAVLDAHDLDPREAKPSWFDFSIRNNPAYSWEILRSLDEPGVKRNLIAVHRNLSVGCE
jgi:hypothetical protein